MNKKQTEDALALTNKRIQDLTQWVVDHHENPFVSKVYSDIRNLEMQAEKLKDLQTKNQ